LNDKTKELKLKVSWDLTEIRSITLNDIQQPGIDFTVYAFEICLSSEVKYIWQCENKITRNDFLNTLWKLSEQYVRENEKPKFYNYKFENKLKNRAEDKNRLSNKEKKTSGSVLIKPNEISNKDEEALLKLMKECDFASSNAEKFMLKLQSELNHLDTSSIESIMNSEQNTLQLIEKLDKAVEEIDKIDERLAEYEDKINTVGEAVRIVGEHDNVIQMQQNNQQSLVDLLDGFINSLDFSDDNYDRVNKPNFSSAKGVEKTVASANFLLDILETEIPEELKKMKAFEERCKLLEQLKIRFSSNAHDHLKYCIEDGVNKHSQIHKVSDTLAVIQKYLNF
jgi:hypothetical protein